MKLQMEEKEKGRRGLMRMKGGKPLFMSEGVKKLKWA